MLSDLMKTFDDFVTTDIGGAELSRELRNATGESLDRRRKATALQLVAIGSMGVIALYQMGLIRHLPELPLPGFDADKVDASEEAYAKLSMPDAVLGLRSYATTLALIATGGEERVETHPWVPVALAAKAIFDAVQAGKLTWDQWAEHRAFCMWCLIAAGATFATVPLVLPEAQDALERLLADG